MEIKNRIFLFLFSWIFSFLICYFYKETLLILFIKSTLNSNLELYFIFTDVRELFNVYLKLFFFFTNTMMFFLFFYHLLMFVYLGLYLTEYKKIKKMCKLFFFFFFFTTFLTYYLIIPLNWWFFLKFQQQILKEKIVFFFFEAKISEIVNFILKIYVETTQSFILLGLFILMFNNLLITKKKVVEIKKLRKIFYFVFMLFSTIITPPELLNQIFCFFAFLFFYELFVFMKIFSF